LSCTGFASRLNQVFTNLIVNGCHAIEEQQRRQSTREPGQIRLTSEWLGAEVMIAIADDGCGFDPTEDRTTSSYGLRNMEKRIADLGGALTIESEKGQGTGIHIRLPLR
jgi:signal transduction histidine kinase